MSEFRTFVTLWVKKAHRVEVDCPKVVTNIIVPSNILNGKLFGIVPTKCDVACLIVAGKVERENFLVKYFLFVSQFDEKVRSIVSYLVW